MSTAIRCTKKAEGIPALDIIRILSALSILLYHYTTRYDEVIGHTSDWRFLWPWGAEAVNVFFFLSGFLAIIHFRNQKFIVSLKKKAVLERAARLTESGIQNPARYRTRTIPAAGALLREDDLEEKQMTLEL